MHSPGALVQHRFIAAGSFRSCADVNPPPAFCAAPSSVTNARCETYKETPLINFSDDERGAAGPTYPATGTTRSAPVTFDEGRVEFTTLFDSVVALVDHDTFTATIDGVFVDVWKRVE